MNDGATIHGHFLVTVPKMCIDAGKASVKSKKNWQDAAVIYLFCSSEGNFFNWQAQRQVFCFCAVLCKYGVLPWTAAIKINKSNNTVK